MSDAIVHETGRNPPWNGSFQPSPHRAQQKSNRALNQALLKSPESSFILRFCPLLRANVNGAGSEPSPLLIPASEYKWRPYLPLSSKNHRNPSLSQNGIETCTARGILTRTRGEHGVHRAVSLVLRVSARLSGTSPHVGFSCDTGGHFESADIFTPSSRSKQHSV